MKKTGIVAAVLSFVSILLADNKKENIIESLKKIVELREEQLENAYGQSDVLAEKRVLIHLSRAKVELAKLRGDKVRVRAELNNIVANYERISKYNGEETNEVRLQNQIDLEQAKIERERYRLENPIQKSIENDVFETGIRLRVDF